MTTDKVQKGGAMAELGGNSLKLKLSASILGNIEKEFEKNGMVLSREMKGKMTKCIQEAVEKIRGKSF